jgi:hypothetical protein
MIMYNIGKSTSPAIAIAVTLCNVFSASQAMGNSRLIGGAVSPFALYVAAALSVPCIVPFTLLYMAPVANARLLELGTKVEKGVRREKLGASEKEVRDLLMVWKRLNFVRATLVASGALFAAVAALA